MFSSFLKNGKDNLNFNPKCHNSKNRSVIRSKIIIYDILRIKKYLPLVANAITTKLDILDIVAKIPIIASWTWSN